MREAGFEIGNVAVQVDRQPAQGRAPPRRGARRRSRRPWARPCRSRHHHRRAGPDRPRRGRRRDRHRAVVAAGPGLAECPSAPCPAGVGADARARAGLQRLRAALPHPGRGARGPARGVRARVRGGGRSAPAARSARTASARATALYPVGCTARVEQIDALEDGRFEIITVGHTRFRLLDIDATAGTPYLTGLVERLGEPRRVGGRADSTLRDQLRGRCRRSAPSAAARPRARTAPRGRPGWHHRRHLAAVAHRRSSRV